MEARDGDEKTGGRQTQSKSQKIRVRVLEKG